MPKSFVRVRVFPDAWRLHLDLPGDRLKAAFVQAGLAPASPDGQTPFTPSADAVARYVGERVSAKSDDGRPWRVRVVAVQPPSGKVDEWRADVALTPPAGPAPEAVRLHYEVIGREIATHSAIVSLDQDWARGLLPQSARLIGALRADDVDIRITRANGGLGGSLLGMVMLGARHILEGADHLAFLLVLLLSAPLVAEAGHWRPQPRARSVLGSAATRVSAFTVGHSFSLLAVSLGWLPASGQKIEVLIAVSVAVTAVHALRPIFPRREAWIAGGFGLIHGMAFATAIRDLSLSSGQVVAATLCFNLGIEIVQLAIVLAVTPLLLLWRRWRWEWVVRSLLAAIALVFALIWIAQRLA